MFFSYGLLSSYLFSDSIKISIRKNNPFSTNIKIEGNDAFFDNVYYYLDMKKILFAIIIFGLVNFIGCKASMWSSLGEGLDAMSAGFLYGSEVIADDGTYLGKIADSWDPDSIFNENGLFGSKENIDSIWNENGPYGNRFSRFSAFNPTTKTPPKIIKDGKFIGYLSVNKYLSGAVDPNSIKKH